MKIKSTQGRQGRGPNRRRIKVGNLVTSIINSFGESSVENLIHQVTNCSNQSMEQISSAVRRTLHFGVCHGFIVKHENKYGLSGRNCETDSGSDCVWCCRRGPCDSGRGSGRGRGASRGASGCGASRGCGPKSSGPVSPCPTEEVPSCGGSSLHVDKDSFEKLIHLSECKEKIKETCFKSTEAGSVQCDAKDLLTWDKCNRISEKDPDQIDGGKHFCKVHRYLRMVFLYKQLFFENYFSLMFSKRMDKVKRTGKLQKRIDVTMEIGDAVKEYLVFLREYYDRIFSIPEGSASGETSIEKILKNPKWNAGECKDKKCSGINIKTGESCDSDEPISPCIKHFHFRTFQKLFYNCERNIEYFTDGADRCSQNEAGKEYYLNVLHIDIVKHTVEEAALTKSVSDSAEKQKLLENMKIQLNKTDNCMQRYVSLMSRFEDLAISRVKIKIFPNFSV